MKETEHLRYFFDAIVKAGISSGEFSKEDLNDPLILIEKVQTLLDDDQMVFSINHRAGLLDKARSYKDSGELNFSLMFYSTYFEHTLNRLVTYICDKKGIELKTLKQIIRELGLRAKLTWFLELVDLPSLDENHLKSIIQASEKRNAFIHFKFEVINFESENIAEDFEIEKIDEAATYLNEYFNEILYDNKEGVKIKF